MPFESQAQRGFMYANHPKIAKRFEEETPKNAKLPEHIKKMSQGGFAGDWKEDLADYMDLHFSDDRGSGKIQHLADGGFAGGDAVGGFDVDMGDSSTARGIPYAPPMPQMPTAPAPAPVFNAKAGLPPASAPPAAPVAPPVAPTGLDPLQAYLSQQKEMLGKYGPEDQLALAQQIQKQRTGFLPNLANAGAGFADAIMQGVARAGPSNFQKNLEGRVDKTQEGQMQALEKAQTGHLAQMKQDMELAQLDPSSPLSRLAQRSGSPLLKQLGLSDAEIQNIPASLIGEAQTKGLSLAEIRSRAQEAHELHQQTAQYQRDMLKNTAEHQKAEEEAVKAGRQQKAVEDLAGQGPIKRFTSWVTQNPAQKQLQRLAAGETGTTTAPAPTQALPQADAAEAWARANPNDPKAAQILQRLGK